MKIRSQASQFVFLCAAALATAGCGHAPGYPKPGPEVPRPENVVDFHTLYKQNCAACHGENGQNGAALPLNNAAYLAVAGADNLRTATAKGVKGTLMPAFARSSGGMLTDQQIDALVNGMLKEWGKPAEFAGVALPPYAATTPGDPVAGHTAYVAACARCHGDNGTGVKVAAGTTAPQGSTPHSIVDPAYLNMVSNQSLRSLTIAGRPDEGVPDWRSYLTGPGARALTAKEIDDIVAWIASHRTAVVATMMPTAPAGAVEASAKQAPAKKEKQ